VLKASKLAKASLAPFRTAQDSSLRTCVVGPGTGKMSRMKALLINLLHQPKHRLAWRALLLLMLLVISYLAFRMPPQGDDFAQADKLRHIAAFAALAVVARLCGRPSGLNLLIVVGGLLLYGGFIEIVQTTLPHRIGDWVDLVADSLGILLGSSLLAALQQRVLPRPKQAADTN
jgi:VanZ family protein